MKLNRTGVPLSRDERNQINENWETIEKSISDVKQTNQSALDYVSDKAYTQVLDKAKLNWKEPVSSFANLPTNDDQGDTRMVRDTGKVYRLDENKWIEIQQIDAGPVNELDDRLTRQLAETAKYNSQFDFIKYIADNVGKYDRVIFKKENSANYFHLIFVKGNKHLTYQFRTSSDDYIVQGDIFAGVLNVVESLKQKKDADTRTGAWNVASAPSYFTTEVGATFTIEITGEKLFFMHYGDTRGGVWEFVIDGDTQNPIQISTYSATTGTKTTLLKEGLENKKHTVVATFKGDDPNNVPSTGAGTARGWAFYNPGATTQGTLIAYARTNNNSKDKVTCPTSNKEYAVEMRPQGNGEYQFVPVHSGTPGVINIEPPKIIVNGQSVSVSTMLIGDEIIVSDFKLIQRVYGRNNATADNLVEITTITSIDEKGVLHISGKMKPLMTIEISDGYGLMLPVNHNFGKRFISGLYNKYDSNVADGSRTNLVEENDKVASGAFLSDIEPNFIIACRFDDLKRSLRQGENGKYPPNLTYWIHHRSDFQKLYNSVFRNATLTTNDTYYWKGAYVVAEIPSVNFLF